LVEEGEGEEQGGQAEARAKEESCKSASIMMKISVKWWHSASAGQQRRAWKSTRTGTDLV
jgi:hypothetical protein